ncbi:hypothetical protein ACFQ4K_16155 [Tistrella bauzanensis]
MIVDFDDNHLLALLVGEHDEHLVRIEAQLGVHIATRGNRLAISGNEADQDAAAAVLDGLYERLKRNLIVTMAEVDAAIRMVTQAATAALGAEPVEIPAAQMPVSPPMPLMQWRRRRAGMAAPAAAMAVLRMRRPPPRPVPISPARW